MEFSVVSFHPETAQIVVQVGHMRFSLELPINDEGCVPEGEALEKFVMNFVPPEALRRQRVLARFGGVRNAKAIQDLIHEDTRTAGMADDLSDAFLHDIKLSSL